MGQPAVTAKEKLMPVDSLQKQESRDAEVRFRKGKSVNPAGHSLGAQQRLLRAADQGCGGAPARLRSDRQ